MYNPLMAGQGRELLSHYPDVAKALGPTTDKRTLGREVAIFLAKTIALGATGIIVSATRRGRGQQHGRPRNTVDMGKLLEAETAKAQAVISGISQEFDGQGERADRQQLESPTEPADESGMDPGKAAYWKKKRRRQTGK